MLDQSIEPGSEYIKHLEMQSHIEGGFFKETFRSMKSFNQKDPESTLKRFTICSYVLRAGERSIFHKLYTGDEIWSYQAGGSMILHEISAEGEHKAIHLGPNIEQGQILHYVIEAGNWMAAELPAGEAYSVSSCVVVPGFEFSDWCVGVRDELISLCPNAIDVIRRLT